MHKRTWLALLTAVLLIFALTGCAEDSKTDSADKADEQAAELTGTWENTTTLDNVKTVNVLTLNADGTYTATTTTEKQDGTRKVDEAKGTYTAKDGVLKQKIDTMQTDGAPTDVVDGTESISYKYKVDGNKLTTTLDDAAEGDAQALAPVEWTRQ